MAIMKSVSQPAVCGSRLQCNPQITQIKNIKTDCAAFEHMTVLSVAFESA